MISPAAALLRALIRLRTLRTRAAHKSLSRTVKYKSKPYKPPSGCNYHILNICNSRVEVLSANGVREGCAIVQFHGGGHTQPMNSMYRAVAERLCKMTGCTVYSIDYKTGDDLTFPSIHDECLAVYHALAAGCIAHCRIVAIGDSFGANLMLSTCLRLRKTAPALMPHALVCISPYIDMAASGSPIYSIVAVIRSTACPHGRSIKNTQPPCAA